MRKINLPKGHLWTEVNFDATHRDFTCTCGAHFSVDLTDNTCYYDEGEEHNEEDEELKVEQI